MALATTVAVKRQKTRDQVLEIFGYKLEPSGGAHTSRTIMYSELSSLLSLVDTSTASLVDYRQAVCAANCLEKRSQKNRDLSFRYLVSLYSLNRENAVYRALTYFWKRDPLSRPLVALLCSLARDPVLRSSLDFVLGCEFGSGTPVAELQKFIAARNPGRFSESTLASVARNLYASWTMSGHFAGVRNKKRVRADASAGSVAYALLLGYLTGERGPALFETLYFRALDLDPSEGAELARQASQKGWIVYRQMGTVVDVSFSNMITPYELELLRGTN